ncbi:Dcp2, box A domain-containing protein [Flagelloscypha sp. PMI_526]|nr:Dcp2, box A domain-containing protein [Flagelloscypha sp. PMI_526]
MPPASSSSSPSSTTDNRTSTNGCSTGDDPPPFYRNASHSEIFEDIESRFIVNLPPDEIVAPERISFQIEQAHWFYEDFVREENPHLKSYSLKEFTATLIKQSDILAHFADNPLALYETFLQYKSRVPVCGAIMLNDKWDSCILVRGYSKGAGWGFPKGKINEGEAPETCAVREVLEETGYNMQGQIDVRDRLQKNMKGQSITLFIVPNVPSHFEFQTRTRKEIGEIRWFKLVDLPGWNRNQHAPAGKYYLITPFMRNLSTTVNLARVHNRSKHRGQLPLPVRSIQIRVTPTLTTTVAQKLLHHKLQQSALK